MSSHNWMNAQNRNSRKTPPRAKRAGDRRFVARKLLLEGLEDRCLLAFNVTAEYATGPNSQGLTLVQIDADSRLDLVLIENNRLTIRLGGADGSFGDPLSFPDEIFAERAVAGDFNSDGAADLVTSNSGQVAVRIGNGDGTFQGPQFIGLPAQLEWTVRGGQELYDQSVRSLATGDLNQDGKLDLVVGGSTSFPTSFECYYSCGYIYSTGGYVNVLLGTGAGSFDYVDSDPGDADLNAIRLGTDQVPSFLAIDDLNNDGKSDVLAAKFYAGFAALLGDGAGRLQNPIHSPGGEPLGAISLGDVDGDGILDALTRSSSGSLIVHKGLGDGAFVQSSVVNMGLRVHSAVIGDVNDDGKLDLVAVGPSPCSEYGYYGGCYDPTSTRLAAVRLGDGQGGFSLPLASSLGTVNDQYSYLVDLALADLTGDNLPDLVTIDARWDGEVIVAANDGAWVTPAELTITDVTVVEGDSGSVDAVLTVTLTGEPGGPVTVDFATADNYDGRAVAGVDYAPHSGTLSFGPGVFSRTITVPVYGDRVGEGDEAFLVNLSNPIGALLRDAQGVAVIVDNEPTISINHPYGIDPLTVVEGDSGTTPAVFTVTLSRPYDQEVTVDYYTLTGHTSDIISTAGTLHFLPGETSKDITVQVVGDLIDEPLEAFNVYLTSPSSNATIGNGAGYCYIEDNDPSPTLAINDVSKNEGNKGTTAFTFTVTLSSVSDSWVTVNYATADGTATTADGDYTSAAGTVSIAPGQTTAKITVQVHGDKRREANETFFVNLTAAAGATISDGLGVGTILNDDNKGPAKSRSKGGPAVTLFSRAESEAARESASTVVASEQTDQLDVADLLQVVKILREQRSGRQFALTEDQARLDQDANGQATVNDLLMMITRLRSQAPGQLFDDPLTANRPQT